MAELNFIVLKINGIDVESLPQDEAVQMFLKASDSILIEVKRKYDAYIQNNTKNNQNINIDELNEKLKNSTITATVSSKNCKASQLPNYASALRTATPTTILENKLMVTLLPPIIPKSLEKLTTKNVSRATQTDENYISLHKHSTNEATERLIEEEHNSFEQCLAPEIDIEEITLRKSESNERLGLTVCYSSCSNNNSGNNNGAQSGSDDNDACTEVYISDIQPDSVAYRDGRLRQGDQILQINGKDIKNKEETESLIAENNNAVILLVSRYLYADDAFNDRTAGDLDVEDDEDDEEFYDDNNLDYENCFVTKNYTNVADELDKVLLVQSEQQASLCSTKLLEVNTLPIPTLKVAASDITDQFERISLTDTDHQICKGKEDWKKSELTDNFLDRGDEHSINTQPTKQNRNQLLVMPVVNSNSIPSVNYEIEHIYETIPEDSETEPFYCSPYESLKHINEVTSYSITTSDALQQQKQRVAQWLGIKSHGVVTTISNTLSKQSMRNSGSCTKNNNRTGTFLSAVTTLTNGSSSNGGSDGGLLGCTSNMVIYQNDEHDNSSSAYNTGGSNTSVSPLILVLNQKNCRDTLKCNLEDEQKPVLSQSWKPHRFQSPKDKITSPKGIAFSVNKGENFGCTQIQRVLELQKRPLATEKLLEAQQVQTITARSTHTNNEVNLPQTIMLQQQLLNQSFTQHQKQLQNPPCDYLQQTHCPQFTAPNLSQYHFVSSQEVSSVNINASTFVVAHKNPKDESMVWKVKVRQDGSRYIVRRPARNRLLRDRATRLNTERVRNDLTTTEEDTISEVKMGRYWSREDRKRHMERARERRQLHQHLSATESNLCMATMCISDRTAKKMAQQHQKLECTSLQLQKQETDNIRLYRPRSIKNMEQQCYQLQFSTSLAKQQHPLKSTINTSGNVLTDVSSKQLYLPFLNGTANLYDSSLADVGTSKPVVVLTTTASTATSASCSVVYDALPIPHTTQNLQVANDCNSVNNLPSLTTV